MKTKKLEVIKLDMNQYGLQESKAKDIQKLYLPMIEMIGNIEEEFNEIVSMEQSPEAAKLARNLRLRIVPVRTRADESRKQAKEEYIRANGAIQGAYNTFEYAVKSKEEKLKAIEEFEAREEEVRIHELSLERSDKLEQYEMYNVQGLGEMDELVFNNLIAGAKATLEAKQEAERKAEEERKEEIRKKELHSKRKEMLLPYWDFVPSDKREEDFSTFTEAEFNKRFEFSKAAKKDYDKDQEKIRKENERLREEADIVRKIELKKEIERKAKDEKERKEMEAKLQTARDQKESAEAELRAKKDKIIKDKKEDAERKRIAELAPDKDKLTKWIESMNVDLPNLNSKESEAIADNILFKFQGMKSWALKEIDKLK